MATTIDGKITIDLKNPTQEQKDLIGKCQHHFHEQTELDYKGKKWFVKKIDFEFSITGDLCRISLAYSRE